MEVTFYGTRGSCPCAGDAYAGFGGNTSCSLLRFGDEALILDAGTGLRSLGEELRPALAAAGIAIQARLLLTHLHYDHLLGLPFFGPLDDPAAVLEVFGPKQGERALPDVVSDAVQPPFFPVQIKEFRGEVRLIELEDEDLEIGIARVRSRWIPHTGPTLGFRIEAEGSSVAYLPDHQAPLDGSSVADSVLELCAGADLVIHDAQYDLEEFARKADWGHSTVDYAVHVAATAGARRLVLFHHDPSHDDARLAELEARAQSLAAGSSLELVVAAREGMQICVGA